MKTEHQRLTEIFEKVERSGRSLPKNLEMEESVLGCIMLSPELADKCFEALHDNVFYYEQHRVCFDLCKSIYISKANPELLTVNDEARKKGLSDMLPMIWLAKIVSGDVNPAFLSGYLARLTELHSKRKLALSFEKLVLECMIDEQPLKEIIDAADVEILKTRSGNTKNEPKKISDLSDSLTNPNAVVGYRTGFEGIDNMMNNGSGFQGGQYVIIAARPSVGKAQPLTANVLTPKGFVAMGDIAVGDFVIGADGKSKRVNGVYPQGVKDVYSIVLSDGRKTECCDEHLWVTANKTERMNGANSVKNTKEIIRTIKRGDTKQHEVPICAPVEFEPVEKLPLPAWLVGAYLGDGHWDNSLWFSNSEKDVVDKFQRLLPETDVMVCVDGVKDYRVKRKQRDNTCSSFRAEMESLGLAGKKSADKFIPNIYIHSSIEDRLDLLRGLFDTDGFIHRSGQRLIEYSTVSKTMAYQVRWIAMSLGARVTIKEKYPTYTHNGQKKSGQISYRLHVCFKNDLVPVSSEKHLKRYNAVGKREKRQMIESITPVGRKECQCISVDGGLYLTDEFIVTHNTTLAINIASNMAKNGVPCLFFSHEMQNASIVKKVFEYFSGVEAWKVNPKYERVFISEDEHKRIRYANDVISAMPLHIDDSSNLTPMDIRGRVSRWKMMYDIKAVFIDYVQIMKPSEKQQNREREIGSISQDLKAIAKEFNVVMVVLSQLNRLSTASEGKKPSVAHLRDSGSLEQDADTIILPYDPLQTDTGNPNPIRDVQLIVGKNREGVCGTTNVKFEGAISRFYEDINFNEDRFETATAIGKENAKYVPPLFQKKEPVYPDAPF